MCDMTLAKKICLRSVIAIAICLVAITMFASCDKEDHTLVGLVDKWVTSSYHAGDSDTIVFTNDFYVQQYLDYIFANQVIPAMYLPPYVTFSKSGNKITFTIHYSYPKVEDISETFEYVLKGNSLTIKGFSNPFSFTDEIRSDVSFKRIK